MEPPVATEDLVGIRQHILDAAEQVIQDLGMKGATTREIARRARCAEGSIYRYFPDKQALFHEIVKNRFPQFFELLQTLPDLAGTATVRKNLEAVVVNALGFYRAIIPVVVGAMSDHVLLLQQRRHFEERDGGPLRVIKLVAAYVAGEQRLGRVSDRVSPELFTRLLLGACFSQALIEALIGEGARTGTDEQFARDMVRTLMDGAETGLRAGSPGIAAGRRQMHREDP
jgi:AcrR family transcriptional regulator